MLNMLCELNKMTDVMGIITACLGSIEKQLFRVSHFNPAGIALTSFFVHSADETSIIYREELFIVQSSDMCVL